MDYKKLIKSRTLRQKILRVLSFVPDKLMIKIQYRIKTGHKLNLKNPKRFTEKIQWYKLYYKNPLMIQCVDKYDVREYVKSKGLEEILVPCYGVYESPDDIDWNKLPNKFVIKDTLGSGGNAIKIIKDKNEEDLQRLKKQLLEWVSVDIHKKDGGREWPYYSGKKHRIIIEQYLENRSKSTGLIDYKFLCFDGTPVITYVLTDRTIGESAACGIFDARFHKLACQELDERPLEHYIQKPNNYEEMLQMSKRLSEDFLQARIDLYNNEGKIYFGEITFYDSSGYMLFEPDSFDYELGCKWTIQRAQMGTDI